MKKRIVCILTGVIAVMLSGILCFSGEIPALTEDDPQILEMVTGFYQAVEEKNELFASRIAEPWTEDVRNDLWKESNSLHHEEIRTWSAQLEGNEYVAIIRYATEMPDGERELKLVAMFLYEDASGKLMIATDADTDHDIYNKIGAVIGSEEAQHLIAETQKEIADAKQTPAPPQPDTEPVQPDTEPVQPDTEPVQPATETVEQPPEIPVQSEFIFPDSDQRYLSAEEVNALSLQAMNYAKNEIYARRGRKFVSVELQQYFGSKSWYNGFIEPNDFSPSYFNEYERSNSELISSLEKQRAGSDSGYPLDQPGYNIYAVGTASLK